MSTVVTCCHTFCHTFWLQELLKGDNRLSACPTIDLAKLGKCSSYKYNRPAYFFQCNLYSLQWDRAAKLIRYISLHTSRMLETALRLKAMDMPASCLLPCGTCSSTPPYMWCISNVLLACTHKLCPSQYHLVAPGL